mgnify:CR=1 FL=1
MIWPFLTCVLTELAAGVAFHSLSLAITGKVVGPTALVASGRASTASEAAPEASEAATGSTSTATHSWAGAVASKMASETAAVAASARASPAQAQSWAVSLDVPETLAVVALLSCSSVSPSFAPGIYINSLVFSRLDKRSPQLDSRINWKVKMTYFRWCGDAGIHWTRGQAACLGKNQYVFAYNIQAGLTIVAEPLRRRAHLCISTLVAYIHNICLCSLYGRALQAPL